jgi:hypothetical protein
MTLEVFVMMFDDVYGLPSQQRHLWFFKKLQKDVA